MFYNSEKYILNTRYKLNNDRNRALLISNTDNGTDFTFLHPVHAILLSFFTGDKTYEQVTVEIEKDLGIARDALDGILVPFLENARPVNLRYDNVCFKIPARVVVLNRKNQQRCDLNKEDFLINPPFDFSTIRLNIPRSILFVINTNCYTNCTYCYADRKTKYVPLSTERILDIIDEAKQIGVNIFDVSGGEFLLHNDWNIILRKMHENGFNPFISTKVPIAENIINELLELGVKKIQISLDSLDAQLQSRNLGCKASYILQLVESIRILNEKGIEIHIKSTLTKETCTISNITSLLNYINSISKITSFSFTAVGYSHYLPEEHFCDIKPSLSQLREVQHFIRVHKRKNLIIGWDFRGVHYKDEYKNKSEFDKRNLCTGNLTSFVLLPDGKVTICEELYWNKHFIIGDLANESIMDAWNSPAAMSLSKLRKDIISSESACKFCSDFDVCRNKLGVCWKNIIAYYGKDKWDFPDPTCPQSTLIDKSIECLSYDEV